MSARRGQKLALRWNREAAQAQAVFKRVEAACSARKMGEVGRTQTPSAKQSPLRGRIKVGDGPDGADPPINKKRAWERVDRETKGERRNTPVWPKRESELAPARLLAGPE